MEWLREFITSHREACRQEAEALRRRFPHLSAEQLADEAIARAKNRMMLLGGITAPLSCCDRRAGLVDPM